MTLLSHHRVVSPARVADALAFLAEHAAEGWEPLAGGTDLLVGIHHGTEKRGRWMNLSRLSNELGGITKSGGEIVVGAMATMTEVRRSELLRRACPLLGEAAATVGAVQIQNRATVAGNLVNASPAGDTLPVWLVLEAEVELTSSDKTSRVPYRDFTTEYRKTVRLPHELVTSVRFRPPPAGRALFRKVGTRAAQAISKVVLAAWAVTDDDGIYRDVRLAFGSMGPIPVRASAAEEVARGMPVGEEAGVAAAHVLDVDLSPIDDVRSDADYRMDVSRNLVREFFAGRLGNPVDPAGSAG